MHYQQRNINVLDLVKLLDKGYGIEQMAQETGKHNVWIKDQLTKFYTDRNQTIIFKRGRFGGIFIDGKRMNK